MLEIARKEINGFLSSLIAYIVIFIFLVGSGILLWIIPGQYNVFDNAYAGLDVFFILAPWLFLFLVPAVSMRLISDEKRLGTIELLLTKPITAQQLIGGKFLAGLVLIFLALLPTVIYVVSIYLLGNPVGIIDMGATIGSYIGLFFLAAAYLSIGLWASAITSNQVVAFLLAVVFSLFVYLGFDAISMIISNYSISDFITSFGINEHYLSLSRGVVSLSDIVYFLSLIGFFIYLSKLFVHKNRIK